VFKRFIDICVSALGLLLASPFLLVVALLVRFFVGSPIFYRQVRPGLDAKPFTLIKFRTMSDTRGSDGSLLPDEQRLTRFGRWLRTTSLDELPELWNVLRGEMSLVGPRPLLMEYLPLYTPEQSRRHRTRPGLTGWAQVNGRNSLSWDEKFAADIWYVDNRSAYVDFRILLMTISKVVRRDGISAEGDATMPRFTGGK
jgi:lipopolysaccharide/colanic/teichoic acid biosynthesis glycosyltransferase